MSQKQDNVDDDLLLSQWTQKADCGVLGQYDYDAMQQQMKILLWPKT